MEMAAGNVGGDQSVEAGQISDRDKEGHEA